MKKILVIIILMVSFRCYATDYNNDSGADGNRDTVFYIDLGGFQYYETRLAKGGRQGSYFGISTVTRFADTFGIEPFISISTSSGTLKDEYGSSDGRLNVYTVGINGHYLMPINQRLSSYVYGGLSYNSNKLKADDYYNKYRYDVDSAFGYQLGVGMDAVLFPSYTIGLRVETSSNRPKARMPDGEQKRINLSNILLTVRVGMSF